MINEVKAIIKKLDVTLNRDVDKVRLLMADNVNNTSICVWLTDNDLLELRKALASIQ